MSDSNASTVTPIKASTIRPGILVSVNTTVRGGVNYQRIELDADGEIAQEGAKVTRWETKKTVIDPAEYERVTNVRSKARALITKVCHTTAFGDLCPEDQEGALDAAIRQARALVAECNATATHSEIGIFVMKGRVASNDAEAAQAITGQLADLVVKMDDGIKALDPTAIREAAQKARTISSMLDDSLKGKVDGAIAQARKAAREISRRVLKNGEEAKIVLADVQRGQIESARIAFLDLSSVEVVEALPSVDLQRFADLDVDDDTDEDSSEREPVVSPMAKRQAIPKIELAEGSEPVTVAAASTNVRTMELL